MKQSHVVIIVILFSVIWSTTRVGIHPDGLKIALQYEQLLSLDPAAQSATKFQPTNSSSSIRWMQRPIANVTELTAADPHPEQPFQYSSFSCAQPVEETDPTSVYPDFVGRTCQYKNLYYHPQRRTFHYYVSPAEERLIHNLERNETLSTEEILKDKMTVSWSFIATLHVKKRLLGTKPVRYGTWNSFRWHPRIDIIRNQTDLPQWRDLSWPTSHQQPTKENKLVVLLYHPSYSFNFGHFLLDDVSTWFQLLQAFGHINHDDTASDTDTPSIPLPVMVETAFGDPLYRCSATHPKWPVCTGMYRRLVPQLLHVEWGQDIDILRFGNFLHNLPRRTAQRYNLKLPDLIRLDEVIAGTGRMAHYACDGTCSIGRISWMPLFRRWMLRQLFSVQSQVSSALSSPPFPDSSTSVSQQLDRVVDMDQDYITFSIPFNNSRGAGLSNFSDIIGAAQERYGVQRVQVANMANMTLVEQAWLVLHSCILVTYEGGGSHTSIFLPPGGTVVLYNSNANHTKPKFKVFYRDKTWYDTMAHVRKVWVSDLDRNNVELAMNILEQYMVRS